MAGLDQADYVTASGSETRLEDLPYVASNILQRLAQREPSQARSRSMVRMARGDAAVTVEWRQDEKNRVRGPGSWKGLCSRQPVVHLSSLQSGTLPEQSAVRWIF